MIVFQRECARAVVFVRIGKGKHYDRFARFGVCGGFRYVIDAFRAVENGADDRIVERGVFVGGHHRFQRNTIEKIGGGAVIGEIADRELFRAVEHHYVALGIDRIIHALFAEAEKRKQRAVRLDADQRGKFARFQRILKIRGIIGERGVQYSVGRHFQPEFREGFRQFFGDRLRVRGDFGNRGEACLSVGEFRRYGGNVFEKFDKRLIGVFVGKVFRDIEIFSREIADGVRRFTNRFFLREIIASARNSAYGAHDAENKAYEYGDAPRHKAAVVRFHFFFHDTPLAFFALFFKQFFLFFLCICHNIPLCRKCGGKDPFVRLAFLKRLIRKKFPRFGA